MIKWTHPVFGVFTLYVSNTNKCEYKDWLNIFHDTINNINNLNGIIVVNSIGNKCVFHHDRVIEGFFELENGK